MSFSSSTLTEINITTSYAAECRPHSPSPLSVPPLSHRNETLASSKAASLSPSPHPLASAPKQATLFTYENLPAWLQTDPLILTAYRPPLNSLWRCAASLWYLHNEWVNVWSHLLPAIGYLMALGAWAIEVKSSADSSLGIEVIGGVEEGCEIAGKDYVMLALYMAGTAGCLLLSVRLPLLCFFTSIPSCSVFPNTTSVLTYCPPFFVLTC